MFFGLDCLALFSIYMVTAITQIFATDAIL